MSPRAVAATHAGPCHERTIARLHTDQARLAGGEAPARGLDVQRIADLAAERRFAPEELFRLTEPTKLVQVWPDSTPPVLGCPIGTETHMRALVIDDSRAVRVIIRNILLEMGMEVVEAGNGREALEQLRQNPDVDLMLVDWNMPEMNGLDFIRAVRSQRAYDGVRIVMVTTETESEQVCRRSMPAPTSMS